VNLQPGQLARTLSQLPGTLVYMPPEALSSSSRYGPSLDIFSFGHLALFTLLQVFFNYPNDHILRDGGINYPKMYLWTSTIKLGVHELFVSNYHNIQPYLVYHKYF
jgi:serine/threonine protein kinase